MSHEKVLADFRLPLKPCHLIPASALYDQLSAPTHNYLSAMVTQGGSRFTFQLEENSLGFLPTEHQEK